MVKQIPRAFLSLSGGRSSAFMAWLLLQEGLLQDVVVHFQNTGLESAETLELLRAMDEQWFRPAGVEFVLLEFCPGVNGGRSFRQVSHDDLSRRGEVFISAVENKKMIPNRLSRQCTVIMKMAVQAKFAKSRGVLREFDALLGIRADELRRADRMKKQNEVLEAWASGRRTCISCCGAGKVGGQFCFSCNGKGNLRRPEFWARKVLPLVERGIMRDDVLRFWKGPKHGLTGLSFDPGDEDRHLSNCLGCFFGNDAAVWKVLEERPDFAAVWQDMETRFGQLRARKGGASEVRIRWVRKNLGRELSSAEHNQQTFNDKYSWAEFGELRERVRRGEDVALFPALGDVRPGGCGDGGFCGTDL